jgi:UDP-glucose 4-epimerase
MRKYLITGGAGFIGSCIAEALLNQGHFVRIVDNLSTGKFCNIQPFVKDVDFILGDLSDFSIAEKAVQDIEYVIHQAAIPSVFTSIDNPTVVNTSIVTTTVNILQASVQSKCVKRVVQASSSAIYGDQEVSPKNENLHANPESPYAMAKWAQESYGRLFYKLYGLETISLRYFNVFGEKQDSNSTYSAVIPKFVSKMIRSESPEIYGDGSNSRDFVYIDNVVQANLLAATSKWTDQAEVLNIGTGIGITLNELVDKINRHASLNIKAKHVDSRDGDIKHSIANIQKAKIVLGYEAKIDFDLGLKNVIRYHADLLKEGGK